VRLRKTFYGAVEDFGAGSVDLLHIDGLHAYEAVSQDFGTWFPKLSERGVIMLHDTQVRDEGFGVCRLWSEVKERDSSFEFQHGHGLGLLLLGTDPEPAIRNLLELLQHPEYAALVRTFFARAGELPAIMGKTTS